MIFSGPPFSPKVPPNGEGQFFPHCHNKMPILFHSGNKGQFKLCPKSVSNYQNQLTICKSQRHFVSAAAAILKGVSLGLNLTQSRCGCTVVCQSFGRTAMFCKNWEIVGSLSCDTWLSLSIAKVRNKRK